MVILKGKVMKKIALLLVVLLMAQASFAYIEEYTTSDIKTLQGTGYSQDTLKMVETARMLKQGVEKDYVPFYDRRMYSGNPVRKWYQTAKRFWDPAADDQMFGVREINFEEQVMEFLPSYTSRMTPNDKYNRYFDYDRRRLENAGKRVKGSNGVETVYEETKGFTYKDADSL